MTIFTALLRAEAEAAAVQRARYDNILRILERIIDKMSAIDDKITKLTADVAEQKTVAESVKSFVMGISAQLEEAKTTAKDAGATDAQLAAFDELDAAVKSNTETMSKAIAANTADGEPLGVTPSTPAPKVPETTEPATPITAAAGPAAGVAGASQLGDGTVMTNPIAATAAAGPAASVENADASLANNPPVTSIGQPLNPASPQVVTPEVVVTEQTPASAPASAANQTPLG